MFGMNVFYLIQKYNIYLYTYGSQSTFLCSPLSLGFGLKGQQEQWAKYYYLCHFKGNILRFL